MLKDREVVSSTLERVHQAGTDTLLFTVDLPLAGVRQRDTRNGMLHSTSKAKLSKALQLISRPHWLWEIGRASCRERGEISGVVVVVSKARGVCFWFV